MLIAKGVGNLVKEDGSLTTTNKEKAGTLNNYLGSVFTHEDLHNLPALTHMHDGSNLNNVTIAAYSVERKLRGLKSSKSAGPDNIHP